MNGDNSIADGRSLDDDPLSMPTTIGPYRILEKLGEGGMGTVYLAEQREPVRRRVALKLIKAGMDTREVIGRFHAERQALACMNHPNIAKVLEAGTTPDGRPYFAMEYVQGVSITEYCHRNRMTVVERIELFRPVCLGIQHAHQKGVVHRDIKPSNILVELQDAKPVPKIIDFGVAKALDSRLVEQTLHTEQGRLIGTPEYMSPEQASLSGLDVDTRTDIYSLGVLLYEMLTGQVPFNRRELLAEGFLGIQRRICEDEPARPSTRWKTSPETEQIAKGFAADTGSLTRLLRGDLDWIVMRCIEKSPLRRYQSASELEADLVRHLRHEPVEAGPPSKIYRLAKFLRKRRGPVAAAVVLLLTLIAATIISLEQAQRAREAATDAQAAETAERDARLEEQRQRERAETAEQQAHATAARLRERTEEFERLEGVVLLQRARRAIDSLDPPWPDRVPAMRAWLEGDAARLVELGGVLSNALDELRKRASPWSATEREQDRATHPDLAELQRSQRALDVLRRAADVRAGKLRVDRPRLPAALAASKAGVLIHVAYMRIASPSREERTIYGEEAFGLAAAERALERVLAGDPSLPPSSAYPILVQALYENGLDAEAMQRGEEYLAGLSEDERPEARTALMALKEATGGARSAERMAALEARIHALEAAVSARRTWTFEVEADQFLHDTLRNLWLDIREFERVDVVAVEQRKRWAEGLAELEQSAGYQERWQVARASIALADGQVASSLYGADRHPEHPLQLDVQHGLVPIGKNPVSGLWEFYDLRSAWEAGSERKPGDLEVPTMSEYDSFGGLAASARWPGIVLVLVPGGTFTIGAQDSDPKAPRYDADGSRTEGWPQPVTLAPFFLAKHECTQDQWARLSGGETPSSNRVGYGSQGSEHRVRWQNPVENISWPMATELAHRFAMQLPTEAQWEYACRAGTETTYSTGPDAESLAGFANVYDATAARLTGGESDVRFEDSYRISSPAGALRPNAWGFHDMHGNVWEWCRDGGMGRSYSGVWAPRDGLTPEDASKNHITRGGSFGDFAQDARSARRSAQPSESREADLGVRFARAIRAK
ncbi:MAG: SUMF1/EgtB/PvdO family nonheme iron enzyme [Planctomycetes bacterium]|nr:SUMF1/EgtB/PvdO family nonheme iron enzyme [Planctomycetota bacterium]MCB9920130.1 SUMF1/EgtB/PvdO family nonheme iron enzyme [Planctomycetota bacterium]